MCISHTFFRLLIEETRPRPNLSEFGLTISQTMTRPSTIGY